MTIVNILDMASTYYVSPSLEYESNRWVNFLSLNFGGLIIIAVFFQLLNTFPLWYLCFRFKNADYTIRKKNNLNELFLIYLFNENDFNISKSSLYRFIFVVTSFLGFYLPIQYIFSKTFATAGNFTVGYFFRNVKINSKVGIDVDITYDKTNEIWQTLYGKFMLFFMQCSPNQKLFLQNLITNIFLTLFGVLYFIYEYKKAIDTPILNKNFQKIKGFEKTKIMQFCLLWLVIYFFLLFIGNLL